MVHEPWSEGVSDPVTIIGQLEDLTSRLDTASRSIYKLQEELAPLEERIDDLFNDLLTTLLADHPRSPLLLAGAHSTSQH